MAATSQLAQPLDKRNLTPLVIISPAVANPGPCRGLKPPESPIAITKTTPHPRPCLEASHKRDPLSSTTTNPRERGLKISRTAATLAIYIKPKPTAAKPSRKMISHKINRQSPPQLRPSAKHTPATFAIAPPRPVKNGTSQPWPTQHVAAPTP